MARRCTARDGLHHAVIDLGLGGGYSYAGLDGGIWLRTKRSPEGWSGGARLGGTLGTGSSFMGGVIEEGGGPTPLSSGLAPYFGASIHGQIAKQRENQKGKVNVVYGGGFTVFPDEDESSEIFPVNMYVDLGVRYDQASGTFMGFGVQTAVILLPMQIFTFGHRF